MSVELSDELARLKVVFTGDLEPLQTAISNTLKKRVKRDIGILGDSFVANCHSITQDAAYSTENYGFAGGLAMALGCSAPYTENYGKVGDTTNGFFDRSTAAFGSKFTDVILTPSFTNDRTDSTLTLDDTKANILKLLQQARDNGKYWCIGTGTPRFGSKALTTAQEADAIALKDWILGTVSKMTIVINEWDGFTNEMTVEGLHPNPLGRAFLVSKWAPVLAAAFDFGSPPLLQFAGQVWSSTRRYGSLTANPLLQTPVALTGAGATAVGASNGSMIATGFTAGGTNFTGLTTDWSVTPGDVGNVQNVKLNGALTTAGGYLTFAPTVKPTLANFAAGDVIEAIAVVGHEADAPCLLSWQLEMIITKPVNGTSTNIYLRAMDKYQEPFTVEKKNSGVLETMRYVVDKTETSISWRMACYPANGVQHSNSKVSVAQCGIIKV